MTKINNNRLFYRVLLKVLTFIAVLLLLGVFINSLFVDSAEDKNQSRKLPAVALDTGLMKKGEIRKTRWNGKEVAVLMVNDAQSEPEYFVYENHGDSGNCPLFYARDTFKDACTGTLFDISGKQKNNLSQGYRLIVPPYHFDGDIIIFGNNTK